MIALLWLMMSQALAYDVELCGQWTTGFLEGGEVDGDVVDRDGDGIHDNDKTDFMATNSTTAARGLWMYAEINHPTTGWTTAWSDYVPASGPNAGCTGTFSTVPNTIPFGAHQVRLTALSASKVGPIGAVVLDDDVSTSLGSVTSQTITVLGDGTKQVSLGSGDARIDTAMALAFALHREDGNLGTLGFTVYPCPVPDPGQPCTASGNGGGYVHDTHELYVGDRTKLARALHELGHAIVSHRMPNQARPYANSYAWNNDGTGATTPDSVCTVDVSSVGHFRNSDEATSAAITEGFADYYASIVLNRLTDGDCFYGYGDFDWDHDVNLNPDGNFWYSCASEPVDGLPSLAGDDYWAYACDPGGTPPLSVASEYDWHRGLFVLDMSFGFSFDGLVQILADAVPDTWIRVPDPITCAHTADTGISGDCPWERMRDAVPAAQQGTWATQACGHGLCR